MQPAAPVDTGVVVSSALLVANNKQQMIAALHNTKRRLTAQFNEAKKKEDEEKTALVEQVANLYNDLATLNASIEQQKKERRALAEGNKRREQQEYTNNFVEVVNAAKRSHQGGCEDRRRVLDGMRIDLDELRTALRSKQSAQLASLNPPRELTRAILTEAAAMERLVAETEAMCFLLTDVIDMEHRDFRRLIVDAEAADRNNIFSREEQRLLADKDAAEARLRELRALTEREKGEKEMVIAQLILQQRQSQGSAEMILHEIRELERSFDAHEKAVAERRYKRTAAYKLERVQGALTTGLLNPLKVAAKVALETTDAIIPISSVIGGGHKSAQPPSAEEMERRSEARRAVRDRCSAYLGGLARAADAVAAETAWMEEQTEMVKALLHNDDLGMEQLSARVREVLQRRRPADDDGDDEDGFDGDEYSGTFNRTSRRSVSSAQMSRWS